MSAIPISAVDAQLKRLYEVAQEYRARNYRVIVGPSQRELPEFLRGFEPDLVVTSDSDRAVVEVKQRRALIGAEAFARMAEIVEQHPGWRLELVLVPAEHEPQEQLPDTGDVTRVRALLAQANELRGSAMAIVPAFAAVEHAMIIAAERAGLELPSRSPQTVLKTLFAYGLLAKKAYEDVSRAMEIRNDVAHGKRTDVDAEPWIATVAAIVAGLLDASLE
jgi:hypothetical protein